VLWLPSLPALPQCFPGSCFLDLVLQFEYEDKWDGMGELLDKEAAKIQAERQITNLILDKQNQDSADSSVVIRTCKFHHKCFKWRKRASAPDCASIRTKNRSRLRADLLATICYWMLRNLFACLAEFGFVYFHWWWEGRKKWLVLTPSSFAV